MHNVKVRLLFFSGILRFRVICCIYNKAGVDKLIDVTSNEH